MNKVMISPFKKKMKNGQMVFTFGISLLLLHANLTAAAVDIPYAEDVFPELEKLIKATAENSTQMKIEQLQIEERESGVDAAFGQRLPRVSAYARAVGTYETREDIEDKGRGTVTGSATLTQPLYNWGELKRRQNIAEERLALQVLQSEERGRSLLSELRENYLRWMVLSEKRKILQQSIDLTEEFVSARRELAQLGSTAEQDVLEMEARLLENFESLSFTERQISNYESRLAEISGDDLLIQNLKGGDLSLVKPISLEELEELKSKLLRNESSLSLSGVETFKAYESIEAEQVAILDKQHFPKLDFVSGIYSDQLDGINQTESVMRIQYYAGLQVTWNIFDGWQTKAQKIGALARQRRWALESEQELDRGRNLLESLFLELKLNLKQIEARSKRENILERRLSLLRQQANRQVVSGSDLVEGEIDYQDVRQRLMDARVNYLINMMQVGRLVGDDPAIEKILDRP